MVHWRIYTTPVSNFARDLSSYEYQLSQMDPRDELPFAHRGPTEVDYRRKFKSNQIKFICDK